MEKRRNYLTSQHNFELNWGHSLKAVFFPSIQLKEKAKPIVIQTSPNTHNLVSCCK